MQLPDDLDALEAELDPAARYIVRLLRQALDDLTAMLTERDAQVAKLTEQIALQREQLAEFQRMLFGQRAEKLPPIESEVRRRVEANELTVDGKPMPEDKQARTTERRRKGRKKSEPERRRKRGLRKNLPVVRERVSVDPTRLPDGYRLEDFRTVGGGEVVRRVEHVREHLVVMEYVLESLASEDGDHIVQAEAPRGVVDGGHYGPGLYAHLITAKCCDSLPLHRIAQMLERCDCPVARSVLCGMFHRAAELLTPIYERILDEARHAAYVHADETTLRVQAEGKCLRGWVWAVLSKQAIAYAFDESRSGKVARRLLGDTSGDLIIDGYSGYNAAVEDSGRDRVGCWGHARRKFFQAMASAPEAREVLDLIVELYLIERQAAEKDILGTEAHGLLRDTESRAVVEEINAWVAKHEGKYPPKGKMGRAITYATKQKTALGRFLDDPKLPLDNNFAERALRIFALGRKNFLFAGHTEGAQNLAVLQSVVATCRLHGVNPYEYLKDLLIRIQTHPADAIDELLPWNWTAPPDSTPGPAP